MSDPRAARSHAASVAIVLAFCLHASPASADWLLTPFLGTAFAGETTLADLDLGAGQTKMTIGASFALLSDGVLGVEADVGHSPGFFQGDDEAALVLNSRVTTIMGSVVVAVPLSVTRESLRPYFVAGMGLLQARSADVVGLLSLERNLAALSLGGGAIGFVAPDTGLRFDVRYVRALGEDAGLFARAGVARLSFWRASVGVAIRLRY